MDTIILYLEDLKPGVGYSTDPVTVSRDDIIRYAREFDPQPYHLDEEAARESDFGGLVASGWHTISLCMGMVARARHQVVNGHIGMSVDQVRFPRPLRPGESLQLDVTVLENRRSTSRPTHGVVKTRWDARNQNGDTVVELQATIWVRARNTGQAVDATTSDQQSGA